MQNIADVNLTAKDVSSLTSPDALAGFLSALGYDTSGRKPLSPAAIGLAGESAAPIKAIEVLSEDVEGFLRVVFVHLRSLTAKSRNDLARVLGRTNVDHLLVLTSNFDTLEFVLLDKRRREMRGPVEAQRIQVVPLSLAVPRKAVSTRQLRALRRLTWTSRDGLEQFDKLRNVFEAAAFSEDYFCNRALFADHYLLTRLREDAAWRDNPTEAFQQVKQRLADARGRWLNKGEAIVREQLFEPLFRLLGFEFRVNKAAGEAHTKPDYLLAGSGGKTAAFVYAWDRWLDGPDFNLDQQTPEENPGACVVTALEEGVADWIIMTNGRQWRLYSRHAHSRATNFYEVDLAEALVASGDTDPNEAFRYWWLFFRAPAFAPTAGQDKGCWLDAIAEGSRDYAKQLGERLKQRIFETIFPHLAQGFLEDRKRRLGIKRRPTDAELHDAYEATLTLLYRLLFLLYAESRDLLPIREAPYHAASLTKIKEEIAERAGIAETEVADRVAKAYSASDTTFYDRLLRLCAAMDRGDPSLNVPIYNGGLFVTRPGDSDSRDERIARFLAEHIVPDRYLASAIDRLARDPDDKTLSLVFIDYKSLEVRHLGSIYEGLLEFKLRVADEDLTTKSEKGTEKFIPLTAVKAKRGKAPEAVVRKGEVYLSNDKSERKASGSYYTPDPIVEYIVEHTVGPVLAEKLEKLRGDLRKVRKTFENELAKLKVPPVPDPVRTGSTTARDFAANKTYEAHRDLVEQIFDFRTLDPAMGSGHFLVEAVDFITDRLLTFLNQFPVNPVSFMLDRTRQNILGALGEQGVSVDPDKLTEVNLLKRHVLKRCIYGVDLNPMAVELAKVSLWLDAFTIGAPLSFLDHHLRCGNSLIGATFKDLEAATKGQLFGIDYDPLLRAIQHVLHVNKMADVTAAEVKQSASEYGQAREELSGYQIVLDLLVARHFGFPKAAGLLEHGKDLDLTNRARFLKSLEDLEESSLVEQVTNLARQADRRFFHWEIEFPEVFFTFADTNQRHLKHKDEITAGSAGFDAVVGNPPYVRQETIKPLKEYLKTCFETYDAANDLYVYFQEREVGLLQVGRRLGMIVSNKWMRAGYGERIRDYLKHVAQPIDLIDFGHTPIFPDADTFPCVLVVARRATRVAEVDGDDPFTACPIPRADWSPQMDLSAYCRAKRYTLPTRLMRRDVWSLEDPRNHALLEKIRNAGTPLKEIIGAPPLRGPVTGLNEAFYIDSATRDRLIREDKRSATIIRPLLRGRDIDRWRPREPNTFLILTRRGIEIDQYPAIKRHLAQFRERLEPKPVNWTPMSPGEKWPGRASGSYEWYELQASPRDDSLAALQGPKIVYQDLAWFSEFAIEDGHSVLNNTAYLLPGRDLSLAAMLNSTVLWWFMWRTAQHAKDEVLRMFNDYVETLPIVHDARNDRIDALVEQLVTNADALHANENECLTAFSDSFSVDHDPRIIDWLPLAENLFLTRASALIGLSPVAAIQISRFQRKYRGRQVELLQAGLQLEQQVATLVEDAYGLTPEERQLLRETRPPREPIDILKARVAGRRIVAPNLATPDLDYVVVQQGFGNSERVE